MPSRITLVLVTTLLLFGCESQQEPSEPAAETTKKVELTLAERLSTAKPNQVVEVAAGRHELDAGLSVTADGVILRGAGIEDTVLNFSKQQQGEAGITVKANNVVIEDIAIENSKAEAIKVEGGNNVIIRNVRTEWTGGAKSSNGAYGVHVSKADNVLIENCVAIGASATGIYVGDSNNIVVRNNRAEFNVAAIELNNSSNADIYKNTALKNSSGILIFNLPNNTKTSQNIRLHNNKVYANNNDNFSEGNAESAAVAVGSGIVINAADRVEIFSNYIADNKTANIIIGSYFTAAYFSNEQAMVDGFDPYPEGILIYANKFSGGGEAPEKLDWEALREANFGTNGSLADIVWDGYTNPAKDKLAASDKICVDNSQAKIVNIDAANNYKNVNKSMRPHHCLLPKLPAITLPNAS